MTWHKWQKSVSLTKNTVTTAMPLSFKKLIKKSIILVCFWIPGSDKLVYTFSTMTVTINCINLVSFDHVLEKYWVKWRSATQRFKRFHFNLPVTELVLPVKVFIPLSFFFFHFSFTTLYPIWQKNHMTYWRVKFYMLWMTRVHLYCRYQLKVMLTAFI